MKKRILSIYLILSILVLASLLASCIGRGHSEITTNADSASIDEQSTALEESSTESEGTTIKENVKHDSSELITVSNALANAPQARFGNSSWTTYIVENQNMSFEYRLNKKRVQKFVYLNNSEGQPYFEESFDVFVTMENGKTYYASASDADAVINIPRFGYYYNEVRAEYQTFVAGSGSKRETLPALSLARVFHTYSDKLHTVAQVAASEITTGIVSIGFVIEIPAKTVDKLVVEDASGIHDNIDTVDWSSAAYVGFDVKNVGIFGYILPADSNDKLTVTIEGGNYVIKHERTPENGTIIPGEGSPEDSEGKAGNTNDFYIGQRIYTDTNHDFSAFLTEAYIERNPLGKKNIKVSTAYSSYGSFDGYDALRGSYMFSIDSPHDGNQHDVCPNRHYYLNFTVKSDSYKRVIYTTTTSTAGSLECAVLLDENLMMLPVPIENGKNFGSDGDTNIFDLLDTGYGESILPIVAMPNGTLEYNLVNLYENWGNFPLKQISFIEYHSPYYHLSTGLIETNCLVPWKFTSCSDISNMLPDHRGMSTTPWPGTFQRTQGGSHSFLSYIAENKQQVGELYKQTIHSYGPTYADVEMNHLSTDGKIKITYHHIEMPQLDENRGYYTIEYEFLDELTITNFKNNFVFYGMGSLEWPTLYEMFSYLDENNEPRIEYYDNVPAGTFYVLGNESPYLASMKLDSINYGNTSIVIKDYEVVLNGEKTDVRLGFFVKHNKNGVSLTLDLGDVTFKKGDKITLNAILTPWGSEETDYSGDIYPADQNIRDIRENTCLNPIYATAGESTEIIDHPFIPMLRSTNGENAEFTISGGKVKTVDIPYRSNTGYNVAVRVYGFEQLSVPIVYEKINGEWVVYELSSANNLDAIGYGAYYDGYCVYYDEDGTYSYSFVINMDAAEDRIFKIELDKDFEKFGRIQADESLLEVKSPFNHYLNAKSFAQSVYKGWFGRVSTNKENGVDFVSLHPHPTYVESQMEKAFKNNDGIETGQYVMIKYRFPLDNPAEITSPLEFFTSTENEQAKAGDSFIFYDEIIRDGKWHVLVVDVSKYENETIIPEEDGTYKLKYVRFDPINGTNDINYRVDIAYFAIHNNLDEIIEFNAEEGEIHLVEGFGNVTVIPTK